MELIFQKPREKSSASTESAGTEKVSIDKKYLREGPAELPSLSEGSVVRHYTSLSSKNFSVDTNFYPLGSCTMKYNPAVSEKIAADSGFADIHPMLGLVADGEKYAAGSLEIIYELQNLLSEITGMSETTLTPLAGAHGELTGMLITRAYHKSNDDKRKHIIVPDESHGTNPASAAMAGYSVVTIPTDRYGRMDMDIFKEKLTEETAAVIMTSPNTLGLFDPRIREICDMAHSKGALMYYDGANMNALAGRVRPGDIGFDIAHLNIHKTFGAPHGGGGPGSGPVGVKEELVKFLPGRQVEKDNLGQRTGNYFLKEQSKDSIGMVAPFYGSFGVLLKGYIYIKLLGRDGLKDASGKAVLNANYLKKKLGKYYNTAGKGLTMHECVLSPKNKEIHGAAMDIAKFLIDHEIHPPTVYFPLIVKEALMIEPTETENLQTLDYFIDIMKKAASMLEKDPDSLKKHPLKTEISRLDEVAAARNPDVSFNSGK